MAWMLPTAIAASALFGSKAASSAASTQANAASQSAEVSKQISDQQIALAREQYNAQLLAQEPFRQGGLAAQNKLMRLLGISMPPNYNAMNGTSLVTEQGVTTPTTPLPQTDAYVPGTVYAPGKTFADGSYVNNAGHLLVPDKVDPTMYVDKGVANVVKPATTPVTPVTPVKPVTTPVTPVTPVKPVTPTTTPTSTTPTSTTPTSTTPTSTTPTTAPLDAATVASYQAAVQGMSVAQIAAQAQKLGLSAAQVGQVIGVSAADITAAGYSPTGGTIDPSVANNTFTSPGQFAQVAPTATPAAAAPTPGTQYSDGSYVNNAGHLLTPDAVDPSMYVDNGVATAQSTANLQAPPAAQPDMGGDMMGVQSFDEGSPSDFQPQPMMMSRSMAPMAMSMGEPQAMGMNEPQALNAAAPTDVFGDMSKIMQMTGSPQEIDLKLAQYMDINGVSPQQVQKVFNANGNNVTAAQIQEHYVNANPQGVYSDFGSAAKPFTMNMPSTVNSSGQTVPGAQFDPSSLLSNFSPADFTAQTDPGYAFRFKEGERAVNNSMAARGLGISGAGLKAATKYGQDMGSQEYQNAYNRFQTNRANQGQVYGNAFNQAQVERTNLLNPLQGLMGSGQTAANQVNNLSGNFTNQVNSSLGNYGTNATNALVGGANARASGYVGGANALSSALSTGLNYSNNNAMLNAYNNRTLNPYSVPTSNQSGVNMGFAG